MRCDWVFRWWIHWCERFGQICERTGSACYLLHAVSEHCRTGCDSTQPVASCLPSLYLTGRRCGTDEPRSPMVGGSVHTHSLTHCIKPSDSVSQCILNYSHQQLWCCRSHCPGKCWGGGGREREWVGLKCDAESLLRRDDRVCRLHRDPQRQRNGGVCEWLTKSSIFRFSGTLH